MSSEKGALESWQIEFFSRVLQVESGGVSRIRPLKGMSADKCFEIYLRGYQARLIESLGDTFEASWWVLGDEEFLRLAESYVGCIPSRDFDLSSYGFDFPRFLQSQPVSVEIPFVHELARFEWLFKELFHSGDCSPSAHQELLRTLAANPDCKITLLTSTMLWSSKVSIYEIWKNRGGDLSTVANIDWAKSQSLICFKSGGMVRVVPVDDLELNFLLQFQKPRSIDEAVASYQTGFGELSTAAIQSFFSRIGSLPLLGLADS